MPKITGSFVPFVPRTGWVEVAIGPPFSDDLEDQVARTKIPLNRPSVSEENRDLLGSTRWVGRTTIGPLGMDDLEDRVGRMKKDLNGSPCRRTTEPLWAYRPVR